MEFVLFDPLMQAALALMFMNVLAISFWTHGWGFDPHQTINRKKDL